METDLATIKLAGEKRFKENVQFRAFLKGYCSLAGKELDKVVHQLTREVAAHVDCDACRECCDLPPVVGEQELPRLASVLQVSVRDFRGRYLKSDEFKETSLTKPCPFLRQEEGRRRCIAGDAKPAMCAEYPYLLKPDLASRLIGVIENYGRCPIVYNVYELLKQRFAQEFQKAKPAIEEWVVLEDEHGGDC